MAKLQTICFLCLISTALNAGVYDKSDNLPSGFTPKPPEWGLNSPALRVFKPPSGGLGVSCVKFVVHLNAGILSGNAKAAVPTVACPHVFKPAIRTATYTAQIDFYKKHFSGLFVFKALSDTMERVVFVTETGFKFFDLEFTPHTFTARYIISGMNKKIIINTFRRDFGLLAEPPEEFSAHELMKNDSFQVLKFPSAKGNNYYTTDKGCTQLLKIESGKDKKKNLVITLTASDDTNPGTVRIAHKNFKLTTFMKKIPADANTTP